jgi:general secretion pathway protein G
VCLPEAAVLWRTDTAKGPPPAPGASPRQRGVTLLEIMIAVAILGIMAAAVAPLARTTLQRNKEIELHRALRQMREAIDAYRGLADSGAITDQDVSAMGFPPHLETLVEGVQLNNGDPTKRKFLRRIPVDPMTGKAEWGLRSYQDDGDSRSWGRENVFDVYSLSAGKALDNSYYKDW